MTDLRARLYRLSQNLWWSWNVELGEIFRNIDTDLWRDANHNPIIFLKQVDPALLARKATDASILAQTIRAEKHLEDYLGPKGYHFEIVRVEEAPLIGAAIAGLTN